MATTREQETNDAVADDGSSIAVPLVVPQEPQSLTRSSSRTVTAVRSRKASQKVLQLAPLKVDFQNDTSFDVSKLPADMKRVYSHLKAESGEDYALKIVFTMRTAIELHRAWHMTLLTSKVLQQLKDAFKLRLTWSLGVVKLKFRIDDGGFELHRKVPYDYDSEYQDKYMRIAVALIDGAINVETALTYQTETKAGKHTARSGLFLRSHPGRLLVYPLQACTCAVIFFGGDWADAGVAACCGLAAGLVEYGLGFVGESGPVLNDILVGIATGVVGSLFYRYNVATSLVDGVEVTSETGGQCLSSIFLGTLYWFFYGTAFVLGLLEIIAGELETGVTRFIAVSVKTFVLCLGASFGMMLTLEDPSQAWQDQAGNCDRIDLDTQQWRIPLYLLCSASALAQYRYPILDYWRGLAVQLVAYEVQYQFIKFLEHNHDRDNMDSAMANVAGAVAAVLSAYALAEFVEFFKKVYYDRILVRDDSNKRSALDTCLFQFMACCIKVGEILRLGRKSDAKKIDMQKKLHNQREVKAQNSSGTNANDDVVTLNEGEKAMYLEAVVGSQSMNVWSMLMPAVYQLVPGAMVARMWFNSLFPPPLKEQASVISAFVNGVNVTSNITTFVPDEAQSNIFSNLMVISTSLAVGLILGFAVLHLIITILAFLRSLIWKEGHGERKLRQGKSDRLLGMFTSPHDDPTEATQTDASNDDDDDDDGAPADVGLSSKVSVTVIDQPQHTTSFSIV